MKGISSSVLKQQFENNKHDDWILMPNSSSRSMLQTRSPIILRLNTSPDRNQQFRELIYQERLTSWTRWINSQPNLINSLISCPRVREQVCSRCFWATNRRLRNFINSYSAQNWARTRWLIRGDSTQRGSWRALLRRVHRAPATWSTGCTISETC